MRGDVGVSVNRLYGGEHSLAWSPDGGIFVVFNLHLMLVIGVVVRMMKGSDYVTRIYDVLIVFDIFHNTTEDGTDGFLFGGFGVATFHGSGEDYEILDITILLDGDSQSERNVCDTGPCITDRLSLIEKLAEFGVEISTLCGPRSLEFFRGFQGSADTFDTRIDVCQVEDVIMGWCTMSQGGREMFRVNAVFLGFFHEFVDFILFLSPAPFLRSGFGTNDGHLGVDISQSLGRALHMGGVVIEVHGGELVLWFWKLSNSNLLPAKRLVEIVPG